MSMIEVKGTKSQAAADPADRYVLKDSETKSKAPTVLSVLLVGVALYLKSVFPSWTETEADKPAAEKDPEGEAEPGMAQTASLDRPVLDDTATGPLADADRTVGSGRDRRGGRPWDQLQRRPADPGPLGGPRRSPGPPRWRSGTRSIGRDCWTAWRGPTA